MGEIKFGPKQVNNPTPQKVSLIIDFSVGALSIMCAFFTSASYVSHMFSDIFGSVSTGLLIPLALLAKRFFGNGSGTKADVPRDQVSEIKES